MNHKVIAGTIGVEMLMPLATRGIEIAPIEKIARKELMDGFFKYIDVKLHT